MLQRSEGSEDITGSGVLFGRTLEPTPNCQVDSVSGGNEDDKTTSRETRPWRVIDHRGTGCFDVAAVCHVASFTKCNTSTEVKPVVTDGHDGSTLPRPRASWRSPCVKSLAIMSLNPE